MDISYSTITEDYERVEGYEISYRTLHTMAELRSRTRPDYPVIIAPYANILDKYRSNLKSLIVEVDIEEDMAREFRFNPKIVSYELYNTTEFWNLILQLNHCKSITEFKPTKKLIVYDPYALKDALNEIMVLEGLLD